MNIGMREMHEYVQEIYENGNFDTYADAAQYIGITPGHFSQILSGQRKNLYHDTCNKIIRAHCQVMEECGR